MSFTRRGENTSEKRAPLSPSPTERAELGERKLSSRSRLIKNAAKRKVGKIRDRTMPISKRQKRSRWMPGKRYIVLLWFQSLFHPFVVLFRGLRSRFMFRTLHTHDRHGHGHRHRHRHHHGPNIDHNIIDAPEAQMKIISKDHELLIE